MNSEADCVREQVKRGRKKLLASKRSSDNSRPRGRQLHTVSCQNKVQTYQFDEISRIEGYNGKNGSNPQGIREISDDLFKFDQIER